MLVLSRKTGESIVIGNDVEVKVVAIEGNRIRIAIDAPREVSILRGELADNLTRREWELCLSQH